MKKKLSETKSAFGRKKPYQPPKIKETKMTGFFMTCAQNTGKCPGGPFRQTGGACFT